MSLQAVATRSPPLPRLERSWRVTTACRVFVIALATGQTLSAHSFQSVGVVLLSLGILATLACAIEADLDARVVQGTPMAEGVLAAALVGITNAPVTPLLVYLAVPPVVAGLRHGWVNVANTTLATGLGLVAAFVAADTLEVTAPQISASIPWLAAGFGTGLLAAWQTRSVRALETAQAPYAAAHRLLTQLRSVSRRLPGGLDTQAVAQKLVDDVNGVTGAVRTALLVLSPQQSLIVVAEGGAPVASGDQHVRLGQVCLDEGRMVSEGRHLALPLRVGEHTFGALVLTEPGLGEEVDLALLQVRVDEGSLRLDTALLFEEVRASATAEERSRLAREIHDGVAQEVASLGYLVDDLAATSPDTATRNAAAELRSEVTRMVSELRLSIFDLRHGIDETGGLAAALADYTREVSARSDLRVHLVLDEQRTTLPRRAQTELLRIGQEAISNARKHAGATNLWVQLTTNGRQAQLRVEDDGVGSPAPRPHHYGLRTMRERAERIDAELLIDERPGGGTLVTVRTRATPPIQNGANDADQRTARR